MLVCSITLAAKVSSPRAAASLKMTESGVLSAWARLPTCVRARSTISRFASISALVSRASGAISTGKLALQPLRGSGADRGERFGDALERREAETDLEHGDEDQHQRERAEGDDQRLVEGPGLVVDLLRVAADGDQVAAVLAEIDVALDDAQPLVLGAGHVAVAGAVGADRRHGIVEHRQVAVPQRARGTHIGLGRAEPGDLPVPARQRQIEQRLAERRLGAIGRLLRCHHVGDERAQIDAEAAVERALHRLAIDRGQDDAGGEQDDDRPRGRRQEQP